MGYETAVRLVENLRSVHDAIDWTQLHRVPADEQLSWVRSRALEELECEVSLHPDTV